MKEYSIVIPTYNESDKITATLTQLTSFLSGFANDYEILVIDDGSTDVTAQRVSDYSVDNPKVQLIKNSHKGKGIAVWTGIMRAEGEYIYLCDADLSTPATELKKLAVWIKDHDFDVVIASREGIGAQRINEPLYRHLMGRIFNFIIQMIAIPGIKDTQCGFKLFKKEVAKQIFTKLKVYNPQSSLLKKAYMGAYDVEVLYIALRHGYKIKEVPVIWKYVKTSRLAPITDSLSMVRDVIKIRLNGTKGLYD